MPIWKWKGVPLQRDGKLAVSEECCCDNCGCPDPQEPTGNLIATVESTDCPDINDFSWTLVGGNGSWQGSIEDPPPSWLSGKLTIRCNGNTGTSADYEIRPELVSVDAPCAVTPWDAWMKPTTAQCDPFRITLDLVVDQVDPDIPCENCPTMPGHFTVVMTPENPPPAIGTMRYPHRRRTSAPVRSPLSPPGQRSRIALSKPMKIPTGLRSYRRSSPGEFLSHLMATNYPSKHGCSNDYREIDKMSTDWWSDGRNVSWLWDKMQVTASKRGMKTDDILSIGRILDIMRAIATKQ